MGVLLEVKDGQDLPQAVLDKIFDGMKPTYSGGVLIQKDSVLLAHSDPKEFAPDKEHIAGSLANFKDSTAIIHFGATNLAIGIEDTQPFVVLKAPADDEGKEDPLLSLLLIGDYSTCMKTGSNHTPEWHAFNDAIQPAVYKLCETHNWDWPKAWAAMSDDNWQKELFNNICIGPGAILFIDNDSGEKLTIQSADDPPIKTDNYGWIASVPSLDKPVTQTKPAEGLSFGGATNVRRIAKPGTSTPAREELKAPATSNEGSTVHPLKDATGPKITEVFEGKKVQCPPNVKGNENIRSWYTKHAGFYPTNYKDKPPVLSRIPVSPSPDAERTKTAEAATADQPKEKRTSVVEPVPVMGLEAAKKWQGWLKEPHMLKVGEVSVQQIFTPEQIEEVEKKFQLFTSVVGAPSLLSLVDTPYEDIKRRCAEDPNGAAMWIHQHNLNLRKLFAMHPHIFLPKQEQGRGVEQPMQATGTDGATNVRRIKRPM